jgi:glycosyltransferase involved in cell wall biosynthesis
MTADPGRDRYNGVVEQKKVDGPLVSIVTPFHNAAPWLSECIRSVLAQTYENWDYLLLDNASTDGSSAIAREFSDHPRVRYVRNPDLLPQVPNYNAALALISPDSRYCKIVQADDWIFPDCLRAMVEVFESSERIGLVGSYYLKGNLVRGYGLPCSRAPFEGKEVVRRLLRDGLYIFGSPSAHMYRSSIVRSRQPFYAEGRYHEDTDACIDILADWDFGFVPQVLSYLRTGNESITSHVKTFGPRYLDRYTMVRRYAPAFFEDADAAALGRRVKDFYYSFLAGCALRARPAALWRYHRLGLSAIGENLDWPFLVTRILRKGAWWLINPGMAIATMVRPAKSVDIPD